MGRIKDFVEQMEKNIICNTWKKHPCLVEDFVKKTVLETIKNYTVPETKTAVKEKINLLEVSLKDTDTKKLLLDGQKYASYIHDAYEYFTSVWVQNLLISNRIDLIKGLNIQELDWLLVQINNFLSFIFKKQ